MRETNLNSTSWLCAQPEESSPSWVVEEVNVITSFSYASELCVTLLQQHKKPAFPQHAYWYSPPEGDSLAQNLGTRSLHDVLAGTISSTKTSLVSLPTITGRHAKHSIDQFRASTSLSTRLTVVNDSLLSPSLASRR